MCDIFFAQLFTGTVLYNAYIIKVLDKNVRFVLVKTGLTALGVFTVRSRIHFVFEFFCIVSLYVC
jgi:hypothetical protein